jgi:hypothetical protein
MTNRRTEQSQRGIKALARVWQSLDWRVMRTENQDTAILRINLEPTKTTFPAHKTEGLAFRCCDDLVVDQDNPILAQNLHKFSSSLSSQLHEWMS